LCSNITSLGRLSTEEAREFLDLLRSSLNSKDEIVVELLLARVSRPAVMERVEFVLLSVQLVTAQVIPIKCKSWIESGFLPEDIPLGNHMAGNSVLFVVADKSSPNPVDVGCSVKRALVTPEILSVIKQCWFKSVLTLRASSHSRDLSSSEIHELSELSDQDT